ncbi:hypothetical protein LCGC14_1232610 [marine sediment metagenome]|uniref:Uncharacterized protein n=1 Tax=marine sediment metagenome TaxID=412755 RepID=A0A0F9PCD4_9ZZZZ
MELIKQLNEQAEIADRLETIDKEGKLLRKQALAYLRSLVHASKYKVEMDRRRKAVAQRRQDPEGEPSDWSNWHRKEDLKKYKEAYRQNPKLGDLGNELLKLDRSAYRKLSQGYGGDLSTPRILGLLRQLAN